MVEERRIDVSPPPFLAWSFTVEIEPMIVWEIQEGSGLNVGYQLRVVRLVRVWGVVGYL